MASYRQPGTVLSDLTFTVPLDHGQPGGEQIELFAREVVATENVAADLPWLLFLQGGPGMPAPRPLGRDSWLDRALRGYRVLLLDQRGSGRSSPVSWRTLAGRGRAAAQADYLANFRADSIVADAELIRRELTGDRPWSVLGQSFGGFATVSYLSRAPEGIREAFITGGLPGLDATADDVYRATYPLVAARNTAHYERYPQDVAQVSRIAEHLAAVKVSLPGGGALTVEAFQSLGIMLGSSTGSHQLHYLIENPFTGRELSDAFLQQVQERLTFAAGPLYAILHEACMAQGPATRWAAQRIRAEFAEFSAAAALDAGAPVLFTGEMIYPWMFETDPVLRPAAEAAQLIAEREAWPRLYDSAVLAANDVPVAAAIYYDDLYVPQQFSIPTARAIRGLKPWVTSEYHHDGLRVSGGAVLDRLISLARGTA
ncbi:MAG: alpha/beta fold hydrolase [Streptosporangiaceae bacterium]